VTAAEFHDHATLADCMVLDLSTRRLLGLLLGGTSVLAVPSIAAAWMGRWWTPICDPARPPGARRQAMLGVFLN
jgi:hypothetical protein